MENQHTEEKQLTPEEIRERNKTLVKYYNSRTELLQAQHVVEKLQCEIQEFQTKRLENYLKYLHIQATINQKPKEEKEQELSK
jgi:DNA replication protein DnaD